MRHVIEGLAGIAFGIFTWTRMEALGGGFGDVALVLGLGFLWAFFCAVNGYLEGCSE